MSVQKDIEEHSVIVTTKIMLKVNKAFENCYYTSKYDYEGQKKYYDEYATTRGWITYRQNDWTPKTNIDQMIALRRMILENRAVLIICDKNPNCDEYLMFCQTTLNGKSKIDYVDYLLPTQTSRHKYYSYEFEGASIVDAYTVTDDLLKQIFTRLISRNLREVSQIRKVKTFQFNLKFKFCWEYIHQEIITYINLDRLQSLFKFAVDISVKDACLTCDLTDPRYEVVLNYYRENCAPDLFSDLVRKRKQTQIEGESYVFDTDGTYLDFEILKKQKKEIGNLDHAGSLLFYH